MAGIAPASDEMIEKRLRCLSAVSAAPTAVSLLRAPYRFVLVFHPTVLLYFLTIEADWLHLHQLLVITPRKIPTVSLSRHAVRLRVRVRALLRQPCRRTEIPAFQHLSFEGDLMRPFTHTTQLFKEHSPSNLSKPVPLLRTHYSVLNEVLLGCPCGASCIASIPVKNVKTNRVGG